ncbi:MAG: AIR synthase-related protein [Candidatus Cryptobacteroides sp.]
MENFAIDRESMLNSQYIIDGVRYDVPPAVLLGEETVTEGCPDIVDETKEPSLAACRYAQDRIGEYMEAVAAGSADTGTRPFNMVSPEHFSMIRTAGALTGMLWKEGHFRLGDLCARLDWKWDTAPVGNMAAFYSSVESVCGYLYDLGVRISGYSVGTVSGDSYFNIEAGLDDHSSNGDESDADDQFLFKSSPYESRHPWLGEGRKCPEQAKADSHDWLIYIPFDPCRFKIGDSLLAWTQGDSTGVAPAIADPDYFIDCYEVVRELVEDGIITAGTQTAEGGLAAALERMSTGCGIRVDLSGVTSSYQETDLVKILFGEVPGALVEISDENFDYFDSQMLLQDVAYYPVGRPAPQCSGVNIGEGGKADVADIIASLMEQASEGED